MKEKQRNSDALKHTINNSFMVTVQNLRVDFFFNYLLLVVEGTLQPKKKCCNSQKRRETFQKVNRDTEV